MKYQIKDRSKLCLIISASIIVLALILTVCGLGIRLGLDYTGGFNMKYKMNESFNPNDVEAALRKAGVKAFTVTVTGTDKTELQILTNEKDQADAQQVMQLVRDELLPTYTMMEAQEESIRFIGPVANNVLQWRNAVLCVLISLLGACIYIMIRFDMPSGAAAMMGLIHDMLLMLSFMVIFQAVIPMNASFIASMVMIMGYSLFNSIMMLARIRENRKSRPSLAGVDIADKSVRECCSRTVCALVAVLIITAALAVIGVGSIKVFILPVIVGVLSATYSSNMITPYIWAVLERFSRNRGKAKAKAKVKKA